MSENLHSRNTKYPCIKDNFSLGCFRRLFYFGHCHIRSRGCCCAAILSTDNLMDELKDNHYSMVLQDVRLVDRFQITPNSGILSPFGFIVSFQKPTVRRDIPSEKEYDKP